ncbi:L-2-amino-thiazoline-4-carboxylic acid hydrolase [uncultured Sneathiella sp.]|uniref:L-2-amino-thiazoline-4-carboxylic acid hydrolase n=1 Tax=uncultured Sneathiella sp. TaxID=879315 RepID=UPI0030ED7DA0|tara:strand:- start:61100 stop:61564 length:465 start_codon:yes stop_codon:yes gene_type:complete
MTKDINITPFQHIKLTVEAQIPLVRAMERVLGQEKAHALVRETLDQRNRAISEVRASKEPTTIPKLEAEFASFGIGIDFEFDVQKRTDSEFHVDVHKCAYTQMMEQLEARDLGPLLICNCDFALAEGLGLELKREKTCMKGDGMCDFRFQKVAK